MVKNASSQERFSKAVFRGHAKTKVINEPIKDRDTLIQRMPSSGKHESKSSAGRMQPSQALGNAIKQSDYSFALVPNW